MRLIDARPGEEVRVRAVHARGGPLLRLTELGLRPGTLVRVIQRAGLGGRLIALGSMRMAIDRGTAVSVEVEAEPVVALRAGR